MTISTADLFDQAVRTQRSGDLPLAESLYRQILQTEPFNADVHCKLGETFQAARKWQEAFACFQEAVRLNPFHADAHNNLGILYVVHERLDQAIPCFRQALLINANDANALYNLGIALKEQGSPVEAAASFRQALVINPDHAFAHANLGLILMSAGQPAESAVCFRQAVRINPDFGDAHCHLGNALHKQEQFVAAAQAYRQALSINPNQAETHYNLGIALVEAEQQREATACFRQAIALNPNYVDAHNNLGNAFIVEGQLTDAAECFRRALAINPDHELTLWNRAHLLLQQGNFAEGWRDYEHRWALPANKPRTFQKPRWDGAPLAGKTILVFAEQGLGDTLLFARYLPLVQKRGGKVLFECQPALHKLFVGLAGIDQVFPAGAPLPPFDVQIPLLSLPGLFRTTLATIPADVPYLTADPKKVAHWRQVLLTALTSRPSPLTIGIVWQGSMNQKGDRRSLPLAYFAPLARLDGIRLVSLQVGQATSQLASVPFSIIDLGSQFDPDSLEDLAAALQSVDLVITVDTAAAHLAGALGVAVWTLLAYASCWRWLLDRSDSPWYPTMRLFRQSERRDWGEVLDRIEKEIRISNIEIRSKSE